MFTQFVEILIKKLYVMKKIINYPDVKFGAIALVALCLICITLGVLDVFNITSPKTPVNLLNVFVMFSLSLFFGLTALHLFTYKEKS